MIRKTGSVSKMLALSGLAALMVSAAAVASSDDEVLERIRPIGKVNVAQPAAAPAVAEAPAATPAPAVAEAPAATPAPAPAAVPTPAAVPVAEAPAAAEPVAAPAGGGDAVGKKTYDTVCFVCHMAGVSNAPKLGDKAAWEPRIAKGMDALLQSSINGIPGTAMPPRGTCAACSDDDLKAAVEYMVSQAQ